MSIRRAILKDSPLAELVRRDFPNWSTDNHAFGFALEGYLGTVSELSALDGFDFLHVAEETPATLRTIGLAYILPSSELPLDVSFRSVSGEISYRALLGSDDELWKGLTRSKKWEAVYLYATEGYEPKWNWNQPIEGLLRPRRQH